MCADFRGRSMNPGGLRHDDVVEHGPGDLYALAEVPKRKF